MRKLYLTFAVFLLLASCATVSCNGITTEKMNRLEIALGRLSNAVEGLLWTNPENTTGLIDTACKDDPSMCEAFGDNKLYSRVVGGHAVLLLCTKDGKRALVEDIACTPTPDLKAWVDGIAPCKFTLPDQKIYDSCTPEGK
ncbi:MAG: hypothetical protein LBQ00_08155 [Syntrophobacterales bacterium]|jgi:hypothetical protein|nr:hypothetical protein [Syntrophobacterales bacterium]